jgi:hypothetical protein
LALADLNLTTAAAKFCLHRQKFALIGIRFADIDKQDAETGNQFGINRQKFAVIGKILPQLASTLWKSAKGMSKSPSILRRPAKNCLDRHLFCGNRQTGWGNDQGRCGNGNGSFEG